MHENVLVSMNEKFLHVERGCNEYDKLLCEHITRNIIRTKTKRKTKELIYFDKFQVHIYDHNEPYNSNFHDHNETHIWIFLTLNLILEFYL